MITNKDVINFFLDSPNASTLCARAVSLQLARHFTSPEEVIVISNEELAELTGYNSRSIVRHKQGIEAEGYWEVVPVGKGHGRRSEWRATDKLIAAVKGADHA